MNPVIRYYILKQKYNLYCYYKSWKPVNKIERQITYYLHNINTNIIIDTEIYNTGFIIHIIEHINGNKNQIDIKFLEKEFNITLNNNNAEINLLLDHIKKNYDYLEQNYRIYKMILELRKTAKRKAFEYLRDIFNNNTNLYFDFFSFTGVLPMSYIKLKFSHFINKKKVLIFINDIENENKNIPDLIDYIFSNQLFFSDESLKKINRKNKIKLLI